jgi:EAL domain-containing protein (putative c-di-GMP-specific phosphodiesterase class I)
MTEQMATSSDGSDRDLIAAMAFCWADLLLEVDENGYILFAAGATESLLGCPPARLVGEALERLVVHSERPLIRAYLHGSTGIKRLEELDIDLQLGSGAADEGVTAPVSLAGYLIAEPVTRYFLAARHRSLRPRARSGIDRLILQQALHNKNSQSTLPSVKPQAWLPQDAALVVLENLAALRSKAENEAANELADLIREHGDPRQNRLKSGSSGTLHEPMIELERRIVAYASAVRNDSDHTDTGRETVKTGFTPAAQHPSTDALSALQLSSKASAIAISNLAKDLDETSVIMPARNSSTDEQTTASAGADTPSDARIFGDKDYDLASAIHRLPEIGGDSKETNLARAVAYALNRLQTNRPSDNNVTAEHLSASLPRLIQETLKSVRAFREIIQSGSFRIALQPIVKLHDQSIHHFEALARFTEGTDSIAVDQIIHFAEGTGLITEFDLAMCRKVLEYMSSADCQTGQRVAVNLSGHSLEQKDFIGSLESLLDEFRIDPASVLFEVTETARIGGLMDANSTLQRLRRRGHLVCLDDFGAGAANFEYLSALDVDIIKFDGRAMHTAIANQKGRAFIRATALLCRELGILTIAEMIHDMTTFEVLTDLGIDFGQGYHFGHPETISANHAATPTVKAGDGLGPQDRTTPHSGEQS